MSISAAAKLAGVDRETLGRILKRAQVPTKKAPRDPADTRTGRHYRQRLVERDAVVDAVSAYVEGETMLAAARARGQNDNWMKRRLVRAGVHVPVYGHRYPTSVIDAAIADWEARA